jgi:uncharacterized protein (DUF488 family)
MIYTFGYYGKALADFKAKVGQLGAIVIDIRLVPQSQHFPEWRSKNLHAVFIKNYVHLPELGNKGFKEKRIDIADLETGLRMVEGLSLESDLVLLCACKYYDKCHRKAVAEPLQAQGYGVKELEL